MYLQERFPKIIYHAPAFFKSKNNKKFKFKKEVGIDCMYKK